MTKLEEKLIQLGYEKTSQYMWTKNFEGSCYSYFTIMKNTMMNYGVSSTYFIIEQQDIDNLQQAFNEMQRDLEILKECEE